MRFFCIGWQYKKKPNLSSTKTVEEEISGILNLRRFSYKELQIATNDFSPLNKIGEGGFGPVFKGRLKDGTIVAEKALAAFSTQGVGEFVTELEISANIEHENLVKLHGCCAEANYRIIVYGYLENNSLSQTLLGGSRNKIHFDWTARIKICIGVARGLKFLHQEVHPHIIHRDIKASNILLDRDLTPKISDFGLAKLFPSHLTHLSTRIAGTTGYLAPEYAIQGQLTKKADIYSFGVLLLEIVCGRPNTNKRLPRAEQYLLQQVWEFYLKDELHDLVDPSMGGVFAINQACGFMRVGLLCTQSKPRLRPCISTVVKMLTGKIDVMDEKWRQITQPALLDDLNGSVSPMATPSSSTSYGTMTFTSVFDRD